jgi:pilus assembly protein CpaB
MGRVNTRVLAIVLAVILALVAAVALLSYVRGVETRTQQEFEPVDAFVAADRITAGTSAEAAVAGGLIEQRPIPEASLPEGAIGSLNQIEGSVAVVDILPGEVIIAERFGEAEAVRRGLGVIPQDAEAVSVEVTVTQGVAGFISPGDRVSVIAQLQLPDEDAQPAAVEEAEATTQGDAIAQYLLQDVEVLAVGRRVQTEGEDQVQQTEQVLMTLALAPDDAERLIFAYNEGQLHFTLLPEESEDPDDPSLERPVDTPGRTYGSIFD